MELQSPVEPITEPPSDWRRYVPWGAAALFLIAGLLRFDPELSLSGDNAQFLVLGQSMASGAGMTHINEADPGIHTKYPPLFPAVLGGVHLLFPYSFLVPKVLVLLMATAGFAFLSVLFLRTAPVAVALPALLLTAVNPSVLRLSHQVLSDLPYLFFSAVSLWLYVRWEENSKIGFLLGAFLTAVVSYYTRTIGITLVFAYVAALAFRRDYKLSVVFLLSFLILAAPWAIRNKSHDLGGGYLVQFMRENPYIPEGESLNWTQLFTKRIPTNMKKYGTRELGNGLVPTPNPTPQAHTPRRALLATVLSVFTIVGLVRRMRRQLGILEIYTAMYVGICLIWPEVWASIRFLVPILPFLFLYLLWGSHGILGRVFQARRDAIPVVVAAALLAPALRTNMMIIQHPAGYPKNWRNYQNMAFWIRENTEPETVVVCRKPFLFFLWSLRKAEPYLWSYDKDKVIQRMYDHSVDYVVVFPPWATTPRYLLPVIEEYNERFELVRRLDEPLTLLYRLLPEPAP